ncbi:MAG TPA: nickel-binding protein [Acidimicrobiales bacterium]|nr:nickel-binding protein [Acidimicrobiales bacterium]
MAVIMVEERFNPPIDTSKGSPVADKVSPCLGVYDVEWLSSYIASDGSRCVCVYQAKDAETVRKVYRTAGVPFENVWAASPLHRHAGSTSA